MDRTIRAIFVIICVLALGQLKAEPAQELFLRANKAYEKGNFGEALQQYQAIKKKGPALWYNMGNCYYQQHTLGHALACWERALKGASRSLSANVRHNCACAYRTLQKEYPLLSQERVFSQEKCPVPILLVQLLFLCCWFLFCFLVLHWSAHLSSYLLMIGLGITGVYLGLILWYHYEQHYYLYGIVIEKATPLSVGPHKHYQAVGTAELGDKVKLIHQRSGWYKIAKDNVIGWVPSSTIEPIEPPR